MSKLLSTAVAIAVLSLSAQSALANKQKGGSGKAMCPHHMTVDGLKSLIKDGFYSEGGQKFMKNDTDEVEKVLDTLSEETKITDTHFTGGGDRVDCTMRYTDGDKTGQFTIYRN